MRKLIVSAYLLLFCTVLFAQTKHVVLISIDGLRSDFYKDSSWDTPNLRKLMKAGIHSDGINSVFPSVTYPSHTTISTGALPARHGVYFNVPFEAKNDRWYWEDSLVRTPTIWDAVKKAGLKSGAVMWPVTVGAPIDFNFPVRRADKGDKTDQLTITRPFVTPVNLLDEMEKSFGKLAVADFNTSNTIDVTIGKMANYIIEKHKPALTAIHFVTVDHEQHSYGKDAKQVQVAIARVDSMIGTVIETVERAGLTKSTAFIITGDHGMADVKTSFAPNVILAKHGLISKESWKARFNPAGGSAFLYLKDKNDKETLTKVKNIFAALPESQKKLFRIVDRDEMDKVGANEDVQLALAMKEGVATSGSIEGKIVTAVKNTRGNHGYFPEFAGMQTGFIASGAGIDKGKITADMGLQDIAPLISELLNLKFHSPDGKLIPKILK